MARRLGSAMISNTDPMPLIYSIEHMHVKAYKGRGSGCCFRRRPGTQPLWAISPRRGSCPKPHSLKGRASRIYWTNATNCKSFSKDLNLKEPERC